MDSDDVSDSSRLRVQRDFLIARPELSACASLVRILRRSDDGSSLPPEGGYSRYESWINNLTSVDDIITQRFIDSPLPNPTTMIHRRALEALGIGLGKCLRFFSTGTMEIPGPPEPSPVILSPDFKKQRPTFSPAFPESENQEWSFVVPVPREKKWQNFCGIRMSRSGHSWKSIFGKSGTGSEVFLC